MINCFPSITSRSIWDIGQLILGLTSWKIWTLFRLHLPGSLNTRESLVLRSREASGSGSSRWRSMSEFHSLSFHGNIVCHHSVSTHWKSNLGRCGNSLLWFHTKILTKASADDPSTPNSSSQHTNGEVLEGKRELQTLPSSSDTYLRSQMTKSAIPKCDHWSNLCLFRFWKVVFSLSLHAVKPPQLMNSAFIWKWLLRHEPSHK